MNTERIKSIVLFSLVIMSFILTTRIWFNVSIEGLFVMPSKDKLSQETLTSYDMESLLDPSMLVVHIGANHTLLYNNKADKANYSNLLTSTNEILKDLLNNKDNYIETTIGMDQLDKIREGRAVELIYSSPTELDYIKSLLDAQKNPWNDIQKVTSIIISPVENKVFIVDQDKAVIHQFNAISMSRAMESTIDKIKTREDFAVFLSDFNRIDYQLYGKFAIAPVSITSMPILSVKKEVEADTKLSPEIAALFNDDSSKISAIPNTDGTVTFTDREEANVRLDTDGAFEYYKYNVTPGDIKYTDMNEAVGIAADYVNQHFGFTGDFYLSGIESKPIGERTSYIVRFDYKYDGIPVIAEKGSSKNAIEVEVVGKEVKRYKRNVRTIVSEARTVKIKTFDEILDIVQGGLDKYLSTTKSESITKVNDLYLAYFEGNNDTLIPVWVVDVDVESSVSDIKLVNNKKYIIGAEEGAVLGEQ